MKEFIITCPCCGQDLKITISETNSDKIAVSFFDIENSSETKEIIQQHNYFFGASSMKGGKKDD